MSQLKKVSLMVSAAVKKNGEDRVQTENERADAVREIGNIIHPSVPVSNDEVWKIVSFTLSQYNINRH